MKKTFLVAAVILVGSTATTLIDAILGVSFSDYTFWQSLGHKVTYMVQGGALFWALTRA